MESQLTRGLKVTLLLFVGISFGFFCYQTDFRAVLNALTSAGYRILFVFPLTAFAYYLGTLSWQVLLANTRARVSTGRLFFIRLVGETVGLFNPTSVVGGDITKIYYLRHLQVDHQLATTSVLSSRITMLLSQIMLSTCVTGWLLCQPATFPLPPWIRFAVFGLLVLCVISQTFLIIWLVKKKAIKAPSAMASTDGSRSKEPEALSAGMPIPIRQAFLQLTANIRIAFCKVKDAYALNRRGFLYSYLLAVAHWIVGSLEFYFILSLLGIDITAIQSILLDMGVIVVKSAGAFVPAQIGVEELGNKLMLATIGISSTAVWLSVSLLRRFRQIIWALAGMLVQLLFSKHIKRYAFSK